MVRASELKSVATSTRPASGLVQVRTVLAFTSVSRIAILTTEIQ
jgi:hypothetical protein